VARHVIVRTLLDGVVSLATGYEVRFGDQRLGLSHAALIDVHVRKDGEPVLDAARIDVDYALRDLLPGGKHRYGLVAVVVDRPVVTITRHPDGSFTFSNGAAGTPNAPPAPNVTLLPPLLFSAQLREGEVDLVDDAPLEPDLARQQIVGITLDAAVDSNARTTAHVEGVLLARHTSGARLEGFPLEIRTLVDVGHGLSLTRLRADRLPLRGPLAYFIHTHSVRFDDGVVAGVDASAYAMANPGFAFGPITLAGTFALQGGRIKVPALARPLRDLAASFTLGDGTLSTPLLTGTVGGMPVHGHGALFDLFGVPRFRMAVTGDGDLHALRSVFAFSSKLPISGPIHLETLLAAQLGKPFIRTWVQMKRVSYGHFPVDGVDGIVDYYNGSLLIAGMHARYGAAAVNVSGRIDFQNGTDVALVADAHGVGSTLPYTSAFAPDAAIAATALITEPPGNGFSARGTVSASGATTGAMTFNVDPHGVGTFGPFSFARNDGSSIAGAFELNRPISGSTGWIHLRGFRVSAVRAGIGLPGARIPQLPPIAGILDGDFAGGGTPSSFGLAGSLRGRELAVAGYTIGNGSVTLGGTAADLRLRAIRVDGPLGRFAGDGAYGDGVFGVEGRYDGHLAQLRRFTGDVADTGEVHGPVRAAVVGSRVAIQTTGADVHDGDVRGIPVARIAGTLLISGSDLRVVAADSTVAGTHAVAGDVGGPFLVSAPSLDAGALHAAGVPLDDGRLAIFGTADLRRGARFDGSAALEGGRSGGYAVSGATDIALAGSTATISAGTAALGSTYGAFDGHVDDIGRTNDYDLRASVPIGDIGDVRRALHLGLRTLEGSFAARVRVGGSGGSPRVAGDVSVPEGSYNGLAFRDAHAGVALGPSFVSARDGVVTVGSTHAQLSADASFPRRAFSVHVASAAANLSDFDDYFDAAETLAGTGSIDASFSDLGALIRSSGHVALHGVRYQTLAFGTTGAQWSQHGNAIAATLSVASAHGSLRANGTVVPGAGPLSRALRRATYQATVDVHDVDAATWLPALHLSGPVLGQIDAHAVISGRSPRLNVAADASLNNGTVFGYRVTQATLHGTTDGSSIALTNSTLDLGFARFDLGGTIGLEPVPPLSLSLHIVTPDIATALATALPNSPHYDIAGSIEADAHITGTLERPRVTAGFDVTNARYASLAVPQILGSASYDGRTLEIDDAEATLLKGKILVAGSLPLDLATMSIDQDAPLSFTFALTSLDLAPLAPFVPGTHTKLGGTVDGRVAVEGSLRAPRVVGSARLAGGTYSSDFDRAGVSGADAQLAFQGTSVSLATLHANLGGGTLDGHGSLDLPFPGVHTSGYTIDLTARNARIDSAQFGRGTLDGTLQVASAPTMPVLSGNLTLDNASIPVSAVYRSGGSGTASGPPVDVGFNLHVTAGRNVRVQSAIIDVGATGALDLTGTLSAPKLGGVLTATPGGIFSTYNRTFRIVDAVVAFDPSRGVVPIVDLRATAHVTNPDPDPTRNALGSADITVTVTGPADELAQGTGITFSSNPPYSREQILGLLLDASLFGAVNFAQQQNGTGLRGAPGESNALLPPGTTPSQAGTINFNQEAFSILNGQFTQRFLAPFERFLGGALNLTDIELTVDYGGGIGYNALKQIGKQNLYLNFGQTLSYPVRTTAGLTARPNATTSIDFNYFTQDGNPAITYDANGTEPFSYEQRLHGIQPLSGRQGFTFLVVRKYP
jgi:hypothetical protein